MTRILPTTLNVTVTAGAKVFARPLRVVTEGAHKGGFAVARRGSAVLVAITGPDTAQADLRVERIPLEHTRAANMGDIGQQPKAAVAAATKAANDASASDADLTARYEGLAQKRGAAFLRNALRNTRDERKRTLMQAVLARVEGAVASPKGKGKGKAAKADRVPAQAAPKAQVSETAQNLWAAIAQALPAGVSVADLLAAAQTAKA